MMRVIHKKILVTIILTSMALSVSACGDDRLKSLAKAEDNFAQAQLGVANLLAKAKQEGLIDEGSLSRVKATLQEINSLNAEAIRVTKEIAANNASGEIPPDSQAQLLDITKKLSEALVRLNTNGSLAIKDPAKKLAFNGFIIALQGAVASAIVAVTKKG
jgi:hypothetical protein